MAKIVAGMPGAQWPVSTMCHGYDHLQGAWLDNSRKERAGILYQNPLQPARRNLWCLERAESCFGFKSTSDDMAATLRAENNAFVKRGRATRIKESSGIPHRVCASNMTDGEATPEGGLP